MTGIRILEQFEFHHVLEETPGVSLVMFAGPACGSCRRFKQVLTDYLARHDDLTVFEVDAERDLALTHEFEVFHLPGLFLFVDGRFHGELQSDAHPERLRAAIAARLAQPAEEAP